jgi:hypothetical protein
MAKKHSKIKNISDDSDDEIEFPPVKKLDKESTLELEKKQEVDDKKNVSDKKLSALIYYSHLNILETMSLEGKDMEVKLTLGTEVEKKIIISDIIVIPGCWLIVNKNNDTLVIENKKEESKYTILIDHGYYSVQDFVSNVNKKFREFYKEYSILIKWKAGLAFINPKIPGNCSGSFIKYFFDSKGLLMYNIDDNIDHLLSDNLLVSFNGETINAGIYIKKKGDKFISESKIEILSTTDKTLSMCIRNTSGQLLSISNCKFDFFLSVSSQ